MISKKYIHLLLKSLLILSWGITLLLFSPSALARDIQWERVAGPTLKVIAIIKPYINVTINSPATIQSNVSTETPTIVFDCNQGPGIYQALNPLTFYISSNSAFQLQFEATELTEQDSGFTIPPNQLSVRFNDPAKSKKDNVFSPFEKDVKKVIYETTKNGAQFTAECDFQLEISYEDKAGTYEGAIFVEVLYQPE